MLKYILILIFALPIALAAQMTYVPDDNFEQALIDLGLDTPPLNDSVPTRNIDTLKVLDIIERQIYDLKGIEDFISLEELHCYFNRLTSLDVSNNASLKHLNCFYNKLTSLDVSNNDSLLWINCGDNLLSSLDISNTPALINLLCHSNKLTSLITSKSPVLEYLDCSKNNLTSLDFNNNPALFELSCGFNQLTTLNLSNNLTLKKLSCSYNKLKSLDLTRNIDLIDFDCISNRLIHLDVRKNIAIKNIECYYNLLTELDISNNIALNYLNCTNNMLTSLDVSKNENLDSFYALNNPNLNCIQVKDSLKAFWNLSWHKDITTRYSTNCNYTDIDDLKFENNSVSISPNPASDFIEINNVIPAEAGILNNSVKIYNFLGKIVSGLDTPPNPLFLEGGKCRIDVSGLVTGVYFVRVGDRVQRFIKY